MSTTQSPADTLRAALQLLTRDVAASVRGSVARFEAETQLTVAALDIVFDPVDVSTLGDARRVYVVTSQPPRVRVRLAELDVDTSR